MELSEAMARDCSAAIASERDCSEARAREVSLAKDEARLASAASALEISLSKPDSTVDIRPKNAGSKSITNPVSTEPVTKMSFAVPATTVSTCAMTSHPPTVFLTIPSAS